mmetsp:Transcript_8846/g.23986  ORF Transcript_8846/g.23986 Transcript_8846/m.23986 type:complete len:295 (-) Transcript_8846:57-941(-)
MEVRVPLCLLSLLCHVLVKAEKKHEEGARNDDVTEAQHRVLDGISKDVLRKEKLDGGVQVLRYSYHDRGEKHPENVVHKEAPEEDSANLEAAEVHDGEGFDAKSKAHQVVKKVRLGDAVCNGENKRDGPASHVQIAVLQHVCSLLVHDGEIVREWLLLPFLGDERLNADATHDRSDGLSKGKEAKEEEVQAQESVYVLLRNKLEHNKEAQKDGRAVQRELHRVFLSHRLLRVFHYPVDDEKTRQVDQDGGVHQHVQPYWYVAKDGDNEEKAEEGVENLQAVGELGLLNLSLLSG